MILRQKLCFQRSYKKLHKNQKKDVDEAISDIMQNPLVGESKIGDLAGVFVYKFRMVNQLALLAYVYEDISSTLTLLALGTHENFYRDLKN